MFPIEKHYDELEETTMSDYDLLDVDEGGSLYAGVDVDTSNDVGIGIGCATLIIIVMLMIWFVKKCSPRVVCLNGGGYSST